MFPAPLAAPLAAAALLPSPQAAQPTLLVSPLCSCLPFASLLARLQPSTIPRRPLALCAPPPRPQVYVASSSDAGEVVVHRVQGSVAKVARVEHPASLKAADGNQPPALGALQWAPFHPSLLAVAATDGSVAVWSIRPAEPEAPPHALFTDHAG